MQQKYLGNKMCVLVRWLKHTYTHVDLLRGLEEEFLYFFDAAHTPLVCLCLCDGPFLQFYLRIFLWLPIIPECYKLN